MPFFIVTHRPEDAPPPEAGFTYVNGLDEAIAEIDVPGPIRSLLHLVNSPHSGWSRRQLADLLHRSGFWPGPDRPTDRSVGDWLSCWPNDDGPTR